MAELVKPEAKGKEATAQKGERSGSKVSKAKSANFCTYTIRE